VTRTYLSQVGVREATNHNDGRVVEMYLHSCGLGRGYAWCAAFVKWCLIQCGVDTRSITAWAASAENVAQPIYRSGRWYHTPIAGDVFTIWDYRYHRVAHTGFFHTRINESMYETVEGNTNEGGLSNGDGVYRRRRSYRATHSISRWIKTRLE
jgi:hypothetical protein